ncbi:MAG TPA: ExeM/NucH family extracellular endonuclease [Woeseiaceae bacterium]|nr:ExeM/NucH family extracellular endonuclease [Woeseiaceae bacterium]
MCTACGRATTIEDSSPLRIGDVQGNGAQSPYVGATVKISGIVSGDFQDNDADEHSNLGGYYLQDESPDDDPRTSDAIFVFDGQRPKVDVAVGDRVMVSGMVQEFFGETQLAAVNTHITGKGKIVAHALQLPVAGTSLNSDGEAIAALEHLEGMLLQLPQSMTVTDLYGLERFGELRVSAHGRLQQFTNTARPSPAGYERHQRENARRSIVLDDGQRVSNPTLIRYLQADSEAKQSLRVGDTVSGITANLRYARGSGDAGSETWRLMPVGDPHFAATNPRPSAPAPAGTLRVVSFNVLNFFSRADDGRNACGPVASAPCRGADSPLELARQLQKIVTAIAMIDADIVALIELENNDSQSLQDLVGALNAKIGQRVFDYVDTGVIGDDAIKTGFLYKPSAVELAGAHEILDSRADPRFNDRRNRPALAQTFMANQNGARLTVVVNHFKSKGSDCDADGDPNLGDGQGNCNKTRSAAAMALVNWRKSKAAPASVRNILLLGDFNAYLNEDPLQIFNRGGYVNLLETGSAIPYSFVYDGQSGVLDHALASPALAKQVAQVLEWHINADESPVHDYNLEHGRDPGLFDGNTPYRASDHDPVIVDLELAAPTGAASE